MRPNRHRHRLFIIIAVFTGLLALLSLPTLALASAVPPDNHTLAFPAEQVAALIIGTLVPGLTYVINYHAPWLSEQAKGVMHVLVAAVAGAVYQAVFQGDFGWNNKTLQIVLTAVVGALGAHTWFWKPSGLNVALGGGKNAQYVEPRR